MTRQAVIQREKKKAKICKKYETKRIELKEQIRKLQVDPSMNYDELQQLYYKLRALPKNASPTRLRNRCRLTGRPRGYYRKIGLSRSMFRIYAMRGEIPGLVKASW